MKSTFYSLCLLSFAGSFMAKGESQINSKNSKNSRNTKNIAELVLPGTKIEIIKQKFSAPPSILPFDFNIKSVNLAPSARTLKARIEAMVSHPDVAEPIGLKVNTLKPEPLLRQLGSERMIQQLQNSFESNSTLNQFKRKVTNRIHDSKFNLEPADLEWLDLEKLSQTLKQETTQGQFSVADWEWMSQDKDLLPFVEEHFGTFWPEVKSEISSYLEQNKFAREIPVALLIPVHMQKMLGKYSPLRGRNCFATALSFNDRNVENMANINLVREPGHHKSLINSDEFAQALWLGYTELSSEEYVDGLKLGDVVAFVEGTEGNSYQSLRHAAVHVGGQVYLHKQSKSAASPIEFTTWKELVGIWAPLTRDLQVKFYRRLPGLPLKGQNAKSAIEKIHWTQ